MTTNKQGFTIIEVVITIAIGAAVMALVLNAVAGARRSQRNNARTADVNQVAAAVNSYIAIRNKLPLGWGDINTIVDDAFGHYDAGATTSTTPAVPASCTTPAAGWIAGNTATHTNANCTSGFTAAVPAGTTTNTNSINPAGSWDSGSPAQGGNFPQLNNITTPTLPTASGTIGDPNNGSAADMIVVLRKAKCTANNLRVDQGGIREMAIVYKLEGQDAPICLEV